MKIDPIVSEKELNHVKKVLTTSKKDSSGLEIAINLLFMAKNNNIIVGLIELVPISKKGVLIRQLLCKDQNTAKKLLNEALMHAWELEYCAAFSDSNNPIFYNIGFVKIENDKIHLPVDSKQILAYSLTYNGLETFIKETKYRLN